jgi:eukaryotic-like serine/threonine-protein kinase
VPSEARLDGRYQLDERIAAGGYGEVWRATDLVLGRRVAVKLLLAQHVQQAETLARFRAEAQRAGALTQANIARVYDYVEPNPPQPPFLVMELIDGPSLAQMLADGPLPPAQVMDIIAGAAHGLQAAHDAGLVHRDIKPANLMLTRDGTVKVTDFGISYAAGSAPMTASGMLVGTAGYMAPERLGGGPVTGAADLYALGIVGYEALTGQPPFTGTPLEIAVKHRDQPLPPLPPTVPAGSAALIEALIAKNPADRPASAGDVAQWAAHEHNMLVSATRSDLPAGLTPPIGYQADGGYPPSGGGYPPSGGGYPPSAGGYPPSGRGTAATVAAGSTAAWGAAPRTEASYGSPYGPADGSSGLAPGGPGGPPEGPPRRRRGALIAALAAVLVVAAAAIGLVLAHSGGSGSPTHVVQTSLTPTATSATTAPANNGGGAQPTQANSAPATRPTTAPTHQATSAPPTTAPTSAPPTSTAPTPTASAAATTSPTAAATDGGGQGDGTGNGGGQGGSGGGGQGTSRGR